MEVHPPEHPIHTWRDFFIHIATIVVGLLIAIGLEQSVEWLHHRHEVQETREALAEERAENRKNYHQNLESFLSTAALFQNNLQVFQYLQKHPGTPREELPGIVAWYVASMDPVVAAWTAAGHTDVLALMPREEVRRNTEFYLQLQIIGDTYTNRVLPVLTRCSAYIARTNDPTALSPAEINEEVNCISELVRTQQLCGIYLRQLSEEQPDFGPGPSEAQLKMLNPDQSLLELSKAYPKAFEMTQHRLEKVLASSSPGKTGKSPTDQEEKKH